MKKEKLLRAGVTAVFILLAVLLVYLVVRQTMPDIIPLLQSLSLIHNSEPTRP